MIEKKPRIGIVGLGRMGANMARRLVDCGYAAVTVYDIVDGHAQQLAEELGAAAAKTLAEVTSSADVILTVVTDDQAMREIYTNSADNLLIDARGKIFINCATVSPSVHCELEKMVTEAGASVVEACMASSIPQARNGELYLIVGGDKGSCEQVKSLLEDLSKATIYAGGTGQAAAVKALVNMLMNINTAALAEALALGQALGLDLAMLCKVFSQTGANSRVLETDAEDMIQRDHECYFSAAHAAKDSGIALELAQEQSLKLPLAVATKAQYDKMVENGLGELDKSGVAELTFVGRARG